VKFAPNKNHQKNGKKFCLIIISLCLGSSFMPAQDVTLDMRYNVLRSEPSKDYFNWSNGDKQVNDHYDAVTGASVLQSTREFESVRYDSPTSRRYTLPRGIRHLMLFPVSSRQYTNNFYLTVLEDEKKLIIRFIVYGTVYQIKTDDKKQIDIQKDCLIAVGITEKNELVSTLKPQYAKSGSDLNSMKSIDWSKISWVPDVAAPDATRKYSGILTAGYENGILTIIGNLQNK
jgi:hypothetical protein